MTTASSRVTVVIGPKTRLAAEVLARLDGTGEAVVLVARDPADVAVLEPAVRPGVTVVDASADDVGAAVTLAPREPEGATVRLVVAALGPVHPGPPDHEADAAAVRRDLGVVEQVLGCELPVHVVLVSTVIALAPGADRRYYGGWKALVEQQLGHLVAQHPGCALSVLHPGRLVAAADRGPAQRVHTTYERLAALVLRADPARPRGRVVGADARIWLLVRSISLATRSLAGSWASSRPPHGDPRGGGAR